MLHILRTPFPMKNSGWLLLINETDTKLREYYEGKELIFVDKSNINESCLNNSKLYLNKKNSNMLSSNIKKLLCQVWCSQTRTHNIDIINQTLIKNNDIDKLLLNFRRNTSSNLAFVSLNINSKGTIDDWENLSIKNYQFRLVGSYLKIDAEIFKLSLLRLIWEKKND